jgi:hypothetical protein
MAPPPPCMGARGADFGSSAESEWLCMELMGELGLPTAMKPKPKADWRVPIGRSSAALGSA